MNISIKILLGSLSVYCVLPTHAALFTYDVASNIGASGTLLSANQDNWAGDDIANWKAQDQSGTVYLRNDNNGDDTLTRTNDVNFGFTMDPTATELSVTMTARIDAFWQAGISNSTNDKIIGIGGDFNNTDDFFAYTGYQRISTDNDLANASVAGNVVTLSIVFDLGAETFDLIYDPNGVDTVLQNDIDYSANLSSADILGMDQLYYRTNTKFAGAAVWSVETTNVPEPSSAALLGLGALSLIMRRRR